MRLQHKASGEIINAVFEACEGNVKVVNKDDPTKWGEYASLDALNKEWEDYTPAEPLIKDEKVRKAVRAWAEANDLDGATFHTSSHFFHYCTLRGFNDNGQGVDIDFFLTGEGIPNLIDGKYYTKFELCGEEEE